MNPRIKTWLPLDRWAQIIGINPMHFHQLSSTLFPNNVCGEVFLEYSWQNSDRVGRQDIAQAIQDAEREISAEVGFNLLPDWTVEERLSYPKGGVPGSIGLGGLNNRGLFKSVEARRGWLISGGIRGHDLVLAGAAIVRTDDDGDGYSENCTVTVPVTFTDPNELRVYYSGADGDSGWEIRPIKVSISAGIATVTFKSWQVVLNTLTEAMQANAIDASDNANYESTVDVYRVYNDPSTQLQFMWESTADPSCAACCGNCIACQFGTQAGCFHLRDERIGIAVPAPAAWNVTNSSFDSAEWSACHDPDQIRLWYYSGWQDKSLAMSKVQMDPMWERAVAYFAASKLDRPVCGCSNVNQFIDRWLKDASYTSQENGGFKITAEQASNKLGISMGGLYAYRVIHHNGVRVVK